MFALGIHQAKQKISDSQSKQTVLVLPVQLFRKRLKRREPQTLTELTCIKDNKSMCLHSLKFFKYLDKLQFVFLDIYFRKSYDFSSNSAKVHTINVSLYTNCICITKLSVNEVKLIQTSTKKRNKELQIRESRASRIKKEENV